MVTFFFAFQVHFNTPFLILVGLYLSKHQNPYTKKEKMSY